MIVDFYKTMSYDNTYRAIFRHNDLSFYRFAEDITDDKYVAKIKKELKLRFASLKMETHIPFIFKFKDPADEAAFLLWSNGGIDL